MDFHKPLNAFGWILPLALAASTAWAQELGTPVRLEADGKAIDTDIGHAAPWLYDFDRDGKRDLLVGQFGEGKLRIYRNIGTKEAPKFDKATWFQAGGAIATTPAS
jgi:hypothetical protein